DRVTDGEHDIADLQTIGAPEGRHRERLEIDLENGEVRVRIATHDARIRHAAVLELHADRVGVGYHVVIGDDVPVRIDDDAGAEAALDALPVARHVLAEQFPE